MIDTVYWHGLLMNSSAGFPVLSPAPATLVCGAPTSPSIPRTTASSRPSRLDERHDEVAPKSRKVKRAIASMRRIKAMAGERTGRCQ